MLALPDRHRRLDVVDELLDRGEGRRAVRRRDRRDEGEIADREPPDAMRRGDAQAERQGAVWLKIQKYLAKKTRRVWRKKIKYDCRKKLADNCFKQVWTAVQAANSGRYEILPAPNRNDALLNDYRTRVLPGQAERVTPPAKAPTPYSIVACCLPLRFSRTTSN